MNANFKVIQKQRNSKIVTFKDQGKGYERKPSIHKVKVIFFRDASYNTMT